MGFCGLRVTYVGTFVQHTGWGLFEVKDIQKHIYPRFLNFFLIISTKRRVEYTNTEEILEI